MSVSCDCSVNTADYDSPDVYRESFHVAQKTYTCCECREKIRPGERYQYIFGVWDGVPHTYRTCMPCSNIRDTYCFHGAIFTALVGTIRDCFGFDYRKIPEVE